ncbi:MAG: hypothetical protein WC600_03790 [Desulfobaccales bacterium]
MPNAEKVYQSPALTQGWETLQDGELYLFDTVNTYAKKYHIDKKNTPIGWDEDPYTVEEAKECFGDDACTVILANKKDKVLVIVKADLPYVLAEGKGQTRIGWEAYAKDGVMAIKRLFKGYALEAVVINPKVKTLEGLGVLKAIIQRVMAGKDLMKGADNAPAQKPNRKDQVSPKGKAPKPGSNPADSHPGK